MNVLTQNQLHQQMPQQNVFSPVVLKGQPYIESMHASVEYNDNNIDDKKEVIMPNRNNSFDKSTPQSGKGERKSYAVYEK